MPLQDVDSFATAIVSIFLYGSLSITCFYFASKFWDFEGKKLRTGLYVAPKFTFFVVLGISALMDLPTFLTCSGLGGPEECEWNATSYAFCWSCHLLATCGQQFAVITPSILWSDIIQQKDGNFWNSSSPLDFVKVFFRISWLIYCGVVVMTVLGVILFSNPSDENAYTAHTTIGALSNLLNPIMLVVNASGCLYSGIRLQRHVVKVQLGTATQNRFLIQLNFVMIFITCTYILRALMVMSLYGAMPNSYKRLFDPVGSYPYWLPLTQWLPFVFCSFSLVYMMRFKGGGADRTNSMRLDGNIDMQTIRTIRESHAEDRESEDVVSPLDHEHHRTRSVGMSTDAFGGRSLSFLMHQNNPILSAQQPPPKPRDLFRNSEAPDR